MEISTRPLEKTGTCNQFWNRDLSLWPAYKVEKDNGKNLLNWLDLADYLETSATQSPLEIAWRATDLRTLFSSPSAVRARR